MSICGFTFVRNAIQFDYPVVESINSILPIVDKMIVLVGESEDETLTLIQSINSSKIEIHHSVWDDSLRKGGRVLATEADKAFLLVPKKYDWAFYIQADEIVHEDDYPAILEGTKKWQDDSTVDGLLSRYLHFYGSYDYVGDAYSWYRYETRILKNDKSFYAYRDAQGFRKTGDTKLQVKSIDAKMYHYGWVKSPSLQQAKRNEFSRFYNCDEELTLSVEKDFNYHRVEALKKFEDCHPAVMAKRIAEKNWNFEFDLSQSHLSFKDRIRSIVEKWTGHILWEFRNYQKK